MLGVHAALALAEYRAWRDGGGVAESGVRSPSARSRCSNPQATNLGLARACWLLLGLAPHHAVPLRGGTTELPRRGLGYAMAAGDRQLEIELLSMHVGDLGGGR